LALTVPATVSPDASSCNLACGDAASWHAVLDTTSVAIIVRRIDIGWRHGEGRP
jgi:hypothetical protein